MSKLMDLMSLATQGLEHSLYWDHHAPEVLTCFPEYFNTSAMNSEDESNWPKKIKNSSSTCAANIEKQCLPILVVLPTDSQLGASFQTLINVTERRRERERKRQRL